MGSNDSSDIIEGPYFDMTGIKVVHKDDYDAVVKERDELKRTDWKVAWSLELAHSHACEKEIAALSEQNDFMNKELLKSDAEIKRLRAALEWIAEDDCKCASLNSPESVYTYVCHSCVASKCLAELSEP